MDIHVLRERYYLVVAIYETKLYIHTDAHTHIYFIDNMDVVYIYISARVLVVVVDICRVYIRVYIYIYPLFLLVLLYQPSTWHARMVG